MKIKINMHLISITYTLLKEICLKYLLFDNK